MALSRNGTARVLRRAARSHDGNVASAPDLYGVVEFEEGTVRAIMRRVPQALAEATESEARSARGVRGKLLGIAAFAVEKKGMDVVERVFAHGPLSWATAEDRSAPTSLRVSQLDPLFELYLSPLASEFERSVAEPGGTVLRGFIDLYGARELLEPPLSRSVSERQVRDWVARAPMAIWVDDAGRLTGTAIAPLPSSTGEPVWFKTEFYDLGVDESAPLDTERLQDRGA